MASILELAKELNSVIAEGGKKKRSRSGKSSKSTQAKGEHKFRCGSCGFEFDNYKPIWKNQLGAAVDCCPGCLAELESTK